MLAGEEIEKQLPGGKVKKKTKPEIVVSSEKRNKNKMTTTVTGLELFGIKLSEASKLFGKKFACGASVTKTATGTEQIEMQGDFLDKIPELVVKNYGTSHSVSRDSVYIVVEKKKRKAFGDDEEEGDS